MKAAPFSFRDTIQYILPLVIGVGLFVPYFAPPDSHNRLLLAAVVGSYVLYAPIDALARRVFSWLPVIRSKMRAIAAEQKWWARNWDYDRLFYRAVSDKEREYLYLTAGYAAFHRLVSFVLLAFCALQLGVIVRNVRWNGSPPSGLGSIVEVQTPLLTGLSMPAIVAAAASALLFVTSFYNYLSESGDVIRIYRTLAEKAQLEGADVAVSIWGRVAARDLNGNGDEAPAQGIPVRLLGCDGSSLSSTITDEQGRYQFAGMLAQARDEACSIEVEWMGGPLRRSSRVADRAIPSFDFHVPPVDQTGSRHSSKTETAVTPSPVQPSPPR